MSGVAVGRRASTARPSLWVRLKPRLSVGAWAAPALIWQLVFAAVPLALLVLMSFWTLSEYQVSKEFTLDNYSRLFSDSIYLQAYLRSLLLSFTNALLAILISLPFAYALAFHVKPRRQPLILLIIALPLFTSYLMRMYAWQTVLADNGVVNAAGLHVKLLFTETGIRLGLLSYFCTIVILLLYTAMRLVPPELLEAARNLGATERQVALRVILPQTKLAMAIGGLFAFILTFGDFVATSILGGGQAYLFSAQILDQVRISNWPGAASLAIVMLITLLLAFAIAFRLALGKRTA